jgi:hypothetical protein
MYLFLVEGFMRGERQPGRETPSLELSDFELTDGEAAGLAGANGRRRSSQPPGQQFLRGPVPLAWLDQAARLRGKALALGLILWFRSGLRGGCRKVTLCQEHALLGLNAQAARRAVKALEGAGLVSVVRKPGCGLEVTILDAPGEPSP